MNLANPNVAFRLASVAELHPNQIAIATPLGNPGQGTRREYRTTSFGELEDRSNRIAAGFQAMGIGPGKRIALLVRFGEDFICLVFALLKTGATLILIDPGMGRKNLLQCLSEANPDGFVAIPQAHLVRIVLRRKFPNAKLNILVGNDFGLLGIRNLKALEQTQAKLIPPKLQVDSDAAIIYTTGSTGPPKGVLYTHATFNHQIDLLVQQYGIEPGGKDLSGFPLFGLFNAVMGTTTIIPDMDPTRPADVDPPRLLDAMEQWQINQAFGSPALWTKVGRYCAEHGRGMPTLRRVLSAGAPVSPSVLEWVRKAAHPDCEVFTPYGATESLPIASIESREVLEETAALWKLGKGTCVGKRFPSMEWKVIRITDGPIATLDETEALAVGEIGELMVKGPVVTRRYVTRTDQNALHKVQDGDSIWHRMGDVGYLDAQDRFWFCGRKSHRVETEQGVLFTEPCEAILNTHPAIHRSALVGVGTPGHQTPVILVEPWPQATIDKEALIQQLRELALSNAITATIEHFFIYPSRLPTDIRHNSKIFREKLRPWAQQQLESPSQRR